MGITDTIKALTTAAKTIGNIEVQQQLIDLQGDVLELLEQNRQLQAENAELRDQLKTRGSIDFRDNFCWLTGDDGNEEGPFCSACWDDRGKLVHLHKFQSYFGCHGCGVVQDGHGKPGGHAAIRQFNMGRAGGGSSGGRR